MRFSYCGAIFLLRQVNNLNSSHQSKLICNGLYLALLRSLMDYKQQKFFQRWH
ncbi:MAG: hypothetical protein RMX68_027080 [Aulosira sp. ZfuVER01]|nr:hypothetical protein [Aulosira sp. ZfuVER01]MDZ7996692.1 hypothetical protein [Aulosira sp. DedVER01a]MDZ8053742.1 hypothetical protein [Aulosira sp. ZfuCHP01]